ncbi:MAG: deoxyribonuclease IV [Firmicutes bacterium]|nr:deoxyribonuclease IV [Bacillota bacterium]
MMKIGAHLSISKGFFAAAREAISIGANTFQYFSRNPRGGAKRAPDEKDFALFREFATENNIEQILAHAPYTLNPASTTRATREFAKICFQEDLEALEYLPNNLYVFHPGSNSENKSEGMSFIVNILNEVLTANQTTTVLFETMSGKGSEIGRNFLELKDLFNNIHLKEKIGVCFDTCHLYSAGYDIKNNLDGVLDKFDNTVGLKYLRAIHLNDSMHDFASNKDRHAQIGKGSLGIETFAKIVNHPSLKNVPLYLETPVETVQGYGEEIALLRSMIN